MSGNELNNYRKERGVSVAELAREMCVTEGRIRNITRQDGVRPDTENRYIAAVEDAKERSGQRRNSNGS
mgnify:CR=1 FL=1